MRTARILSSLLLVALVGVQGTAAQAAPRTERLKLQAERVTSSIYLFDPYATAEPVFPAVTASAVLSGCQAGATYWSSATLEQDGNVYSEWGGRPGSGEVICSDAGTTGVSTDPLISFDETIHPGRAVLTISVRSDVTGAAVTTTRVVTIPG